MSVFDPQFNTVADLKVHAYTMGSIDASQDLKRRNRPYNSDDLCVAYELGYLDYFTTPKPEAAS